MHFKQLIIIRSLKNKNNQLHLKIALILSCDINLNLLPKPVTRPQIKDQQFKVF